MVFEDLVIVGSRVPDRVQRRFDPPGTVQAYDARTGERRWVFFTIPQSNDDFGAGTWSDGDDARIFLNSRDRLYAIDAATGEPDAGFGESGSAADRGPRSAASTSTRHRRRWCSRIW